MHALFSLFLERFADYLKTFTDSLTTAALYTMATGEPLHEGDAGITLYECEKWLKNGTCVVAA